MVAKKILVVDDDPEMVELLTGLLQDCGHSVVIARNAWMPSMSAGGSCRI